MKRALLAVLFAVLCVGVQGQTRGGLQNLSVDFMTRGYFFAGSRIVDKDAPGGFGPSDNFPRAIAPGMKVPEGQLSLVVLPDEESVFAKKYRGLKVLVVNSTTDTVGLAASDSRLNIVQEALDRDGQWKPIEYLPSSWCGNSYHNVYLPANYQWSFTAPRYEGTLKTQIRAALGYKKSLEAEEQWLYSNEIEGSVNPRQFDQVRKYESKGIMDPYDN